MISVLLKTTDKDTPLLFFKKSECLYKSIEAVTEALSEESMHDEKHSWYIACLNCECNISLQDR